MDRPCHSVLIGLVTQFSRLCRIGQEAAFHNDDGSFGFFQKIIAVVGLDLPVVLRIQILDQLLDPLALRSGVSKQEVIETFRQFQDFINIRYQIADTNGREFEAREENCRKALDILLYGVIERENTNHA